MTVDQDYFRQILACLLLPDNEDRVKAEEAYNAISVPDKVLCLMNSINDATLDGTQKQFVCVLMRRLITSDYKEFCAALTAEQQASLKSSLLMMLQSKLDELLRRKLCDVVAELALYSVDDDGNNTWPEFLQFLFQSVNSSVPDLIDSALRIFADVPGAFGNQQYVYLDVIKRMLLQTLSPPCSIQIRTQAVKAVCSFIILNEKEHEVQKHFQELVPHIVGVLEECIGLDVADQSLKSFIDMCESSPKFIRSHLSNIIQLCLKTVANNDVQDEIHHLALEVIVTLCEVSGPSMRKLAQSYVANVVNHCLLMMTELDEEPEWSTMDKVVEDEEDSNTTIGETAIDRIACALGGKIVLPHVTRAIPAMLSNPDWRYRHAALMTISAIGEGCLKQMLALLPEIMNGGVLPFLQDPHPRVRYAACNAVGQIASDFAPNLQKQFHEKVIGGLLFLLNDNLNPRVQAHAGAALVNFCEDCPKYILLKHLETIMSKLLEVLVSKFDELMNKGTKLVLEQVITTIASVADTAEEHFSPFYDRTLPYLKRIITDARAKELQLLRGKALECVSLIGLAVGSDKFMEDAKGVMNILLESDIVTVDSISEDDAFNTYLISFWARVCMVLGKDFQPYLPLVIDRVLKTAAMKPEVAVLDNDSLEQSEYDSDWQFVSIGDQQNFGIRTRGLEDKVSACEMLVCYARELKEGFADYAEEVCRLMVSLLKFYFHDGVRTAASQSLPYLLQCVQVKGTQYVKDMWNYICPELLRAIASDTENSVIGDMYYSLGQCIEFLGKESMNDGVNDGWLKMLVGIIEKSIEEYYEEVQKTTMQKEEESEEDVTEESAAVENAESNYKIIKVSDILHSLFLTYGEDFFPYFDEILPYIMDVLAHTPSRTHHWGLCIFDDLIEYTGPACKRYESYFLEPIMEYRTHRTAEVRQASLYGIGVLAMHGGLQYAGQCAELVGKLLEIIKDPTSKNPEYETATENAVSALTKILKYNSSQINVDEVLPHWLQALPIFEDEDEVPHVYGYLCDLIENNHPVILGTNNSNLPRIISVMLEVFVREAIKNDHVIAQRMIMIIRQLKKSEELLQACLTKLNKEQQVALYEILNSN